MTGPAGNSEFCFPSTSMFPSASPREALRVSGKQNSLCLIFSGLLNENDNPKEKRLLVRGTMSAFSLFYSKRVVLIVTCLAQRTFCSICIQMTSLSSKYRLMVSNPLHFQIMVQNQKWINPSFWKWQQNVIAQPHTHIEKKRKPMNWSSHGCHG